MLFRDCPNCGKTCEFNSKNALNLAVKTNSYCRYCANRIKYPSKKNGSCKNLNNGHYESYYWLGFLCADGHFSEARRVCISLSIKDIEHLKKLAVFLGNTKVTTKGLYCSLSIMDTDELSILCEKYRITSNKTFNPIDFNSIEGVRNKLCFIAGFIDGDGCIRNQSGRKDFTLGIKVQKNWLPVLEQFNQILDSNKTPIRIYDNYAVLAICENTQLQKLKRIMLQLNIPLLNRKWDVIDLAFEGKYQKSLRQKLKAYKMLDEGFSRKEIMSTLNLSAAWICGIIKKRKINING